MTLFLIQLTGALLGLGLILSGFKLSYNSLKILTVSLGIIFVIATSLNQIDNNLTTTVTKLVTK